MLTKIGPTVFGTHIDKNRRTIATPTKDFPVPGGPCKQEKKLEDRSVDYQYYVRIL